MTYGLTVPYKVNSGAPAGVGSLLGSSPLVARGKNAVLPEEGGRWALVVQQILGVAKTVLLANRGYFYQHGGWGFVKIVFTMNFAQNADLF